MAGNKKALNPGKPKYINAILIVGLVLLLSGALGLIYTNYNNLVIAIKEQVPISAYLPLSTSLEDAQILADDLLREEFTREVKLVSQDQAKEKFMELFQDDFSDILEYNPLPASIDLYPKAEFLTPEKLEIIEKTLQLKYQIPPSGIVNNKDLVAKIDENLNNVSWILSAACAVMLILSIILINSTVKLSLYSDRFLLKSQQLVGAKRSFIMRPYLIRAIINGCFSGAIAIGALYAGLYFAEEFVPQLNMIIEEEQVITVFIIILTVGAVFTFISTRTSLIRYLKMSLDDLY